MRDNFSLTKKLKVKLVLIGTGFLPEINKKTVGERGRLAGMLRPCYNKVQEK